MNAADVKWWVYQTPYRHYRANNVLDSASYQALSASFMNILDNTEGRGNGPVQMRKSNERYDARMLGITDRLAPQFQPFFGDEWLSSLARMVKLPVVPRYDGGLHSSPPGSRDGWIHTDLCSGWFDEGRPEQSILPSRSKVDYFSGTPKTPDAKPVEYVRACTMIFYLCNDGWTQGDGGETGLYASSKLSAHAPHDLLPPINNSLLVFECSPHSFHRFVSNPGRTRNSIILWLHSTVDKAESMWGDAINRRKPS
jgi:hypothetical protein